MKNEKSKLIFGWKEIRTILADNVSVRTLQRWNKSVKLQRIKTTKKTMITTRDFINDWLYELDRINS